MKFPKTIGACIDALYKMQAKRHAIEKAVEPLKAVERQLEEHIMLTFDKADLEGARGKLAVAGITRSVVPSVEDWDKLYKYIGKKGAWDLLQRRVSATAYRARLDEKVVVPGVQPFNVVKLSLRKRS